MRVTLKLFASLAIHLPVEARPNLRVELDVDDGTTVLTMIQRQGIPLAQCAIVLLDGHWVAPEQRAALVLAEGQALAIWPPVAGG